MIINYKSTTLNYKSQIVGKHTDIKNVVLVD
jgi:hypothetical protein